MGDVRKRDTTVFWTTLSRRIRSGQNCQSSEIEATSGQH